MLQLTILYVIVGATLLFGTLTNALYIGKIATILYILIVVIGGYTIINEIECVIKGKCYVLSWMHTIAASFAFLTLCTYYIYALLKKRSVDKLNPQPILQNQYIASLLTQIKTFTGIDIEKHINA